MIDPEQVAGAARRLGAKLVADQGEDLMMSFIGQSGSIEDFDLNAPNAAIVVVARGAAMVRLSGWLLKTPPKSMEMEAPQRAVAVSPISREPIDIHSVREMVSAWRAIAANIHVYDLASQRLLNRCATDLETLAREKGIP